MVAISRCLGPLALFLAGAEGARIHRKKGSDASIASEVEDCYSKYDGKTLLHLTPCNSADFERISLQLKRLGCTLVEDDFKVPQNGCADAEAVCSSMEAADPLEWVEHRGSASIVSTDAGAHWRESSGVPQPFTEGGLGMASDFYSNWRDLDARMARVESVVQASGGAATIETVGKSLQGRDMKIVRFTGQGYSLGGPKVVAIFNIHAREWIAGMSGVYAVEQLAAKVKEDPDYLTGMEVVFMPMANPDGFVHSSNKDRMHRKNMYNMSSGSPFCTNKGVDLNRNFDAKWSISGSSNSLCLDTYHGPSAMSEPETNVIAKVMNEAPMTVFIDVHAYSKLILTAYAWTTKKHPRSEEYRTIGAAAQKAIKATHGTQFTEGPWGTDLYLASGTTGDYADDRGALGLCFELRPGKYGGGGFKPPPSDILPGAEECYNGLLATIDYAANPPPPPSPTPAPPGNCPWHGCLFGCSGEDCQYCERCQ